MEVEQVSVVLERSPRLAQRGERRVPVNEGTVELVLTAHQVEDLPRTIPRLLDEVRRQLARPVGRPASGVVIDLSAVPLVPACSPLLLLFRLVRRLVRRSVGPDARVVVAGVGPALSACLVPDLPTGVVLVDGRGRRWSGSAAVSPG
jgi:hypothetical protein